MYENVSFVIRDIGKHHSIIIIHVPGYLLTTSFVSQVTYKVEGFLDKNNDLLYRDLSQAMFACKHALLQTLFPEGRSHTTWVT